MADAAPTAAGRDRLITAMRGVSMVLVVCVHIGFSFVVESGRNLNNFKQGTFWIDAISWVLVWVIGGFFLSSGAVMFRSSRMPIVTFWRKRGVRLLVPYYLFVAIVLPIQYLLFNKTLGVCQDFGAQKIVTWIFPLHVDCLGIAQGPFWFLMVFIPIVLCVPWLRKIYDSKATWAFPLGALIVLVILDIFDLAVFDTNFFASAFVDGINQGTFNPMSLVIVAFQTYLFWTVVLYCGFFWADGTFAKLGAKLVPIGLGSLALMLGLVIAGLYPSNAFGYAWAGGNQFPPLITWILGTVGWIALFLYWRAPLERWSSVKGVKGALDWCADKSLTILIWHMVVYEFVYWILRYAGGGGPASRGAIITFLDGWPQFAQRWFWIALVWLALIPVVNLMSRLEGIVAGWVDRLIGLVADRSPRPSNAG